jgi:uncharacterized protein
MDVTPLIRSDLNIIQSYKDDVIKVTGKHYKAPIAVTCDAVYALDFLNELNDPVQISFLSDQAQIILVGYKNGFMPVAPHIQQKFREVGLTIDAMDYGAAARTYNVLATEGRPVAVLFF